MPNRKIIANLHAKSHIQDRWQPLNTMIKLKRLYAKIWNDPVWSKVIAVGIISIITLIITNWNELLGLIKLPPWLAYAVLGAVVLALGYIIFRWIQNSRNKEIPSIGVRYDVLSKILGGPQMILCYVMCDINKETKLQDIVQSVKKTLWEYKMHGLDYGSDWEIMCWETKRVYKKSDLNTKLSYLGIKKNYNLEIIAYFDKKRADEIPDAPEAYINYGQSYDY